jgi:hypothetical protein
MNENDIFNFQGHSTMKQRGNCSPFHLVAAKNACALAVDIQRKYKGEQPSKEDRDLYVAMSSTTVMCSVAALESRINEYIIDNKKQIDNAPEITDPKIIAKYKLKKGISMSEQLLEQTNLLCKCDIIWFIKKGTILPYSPLRENIWYLTELRNALTHFTPEWDDELARHAKLKTSKKNRFMLSPFYAPEGLLFFPYQCMCASCAEWAVKSTVAFLRLFNSTIC